MSLVHVLQMGSYTFPLKIHGEHLHSKVCHTFWFIIFPMIKISAFTLFNVKSMGPVYAKTVSHILLHNFLNIQRIFNPQKVLES